MSNVLLPYQKAWVENNAKVSVYKKSRRIGITWAEAVWSVRRRISHKIDHWFMSRDLDSAVEFLRYCKTWAEVVNVATEETAIDIEGATTKILTFPNGARICALSSSPNVFRSKGGDVTLDEFAFHEQAEAVYTAAQPTPTWGGVLRIISTPGGSQTTFQRLFEKQGKIAKFQTTLIDAVEQGLAEKVPGDHLREPDPRKAFIDGIRDSSLSDASYRQEYLCEDVNEETIITTDAYKRCILGTEIQPDLSQFKDGELYIGIDIGRKNNYSVIYAIEHGVDPTAAEHLQDCYRTVAFRELDNMPFAEQSAIFRTWLEHPAVCGACIDSTGIGLQISEELETICPMLEPVSITKPIKAQLVERLAKLVSQRRLGLPGDDESIKDFTAMRRIPMQGGSFRYDGTSGRSHCDRFIACGLALHAASVSSRVSFSSSLNTNNGQTQ